MADQSIILELLRQDQQEKLRQQSAPAVASQTVIQGIMQGLQIYDMVKGLGTKYGKPGKPGTPGIPAAPAAAGTAPGTPPASLLAALQGGGGGTAGVTPSMPAPITSAGMVPPTGFATLPTAGTPPILGDVQLNQLLTMAGITKAAPGMASALAPQASQLLGIPADLTPAPTILPIADPTAPGGFSWLTAPAGEKVNTGLALAQSRASTAAETEQTKKDLAAAANQIKLLQEENKRKRIGETQSLESARKTWETFLKQVAKGEEPPDSVVKSAVSAGKKIGEDTSPFEKIKSPGRLQEWIKYALSKIPRPPSPAAGVGKGKHLVTDSSGRQVWLDDDDLKKARVEDPGLKVVGE